MSSSIDSAELPQHVAIIMDGNRRWAREKSLPQLEGHRRGSQKARELIEECARLGIPHLTLWAFSTDNWKRDPSEVKGILSLLENYLKTAVDELHEEGIKLVHLGRKDRLSETLQGLLSAAELKTCDNTRLTLNLCIDYGGRDEILRAVNKACEAGKTGWTEADFSVILDTAGSPDPDLIIRTSGEHRLSGFLLWQSAYSELVFTDTCFPDFSAEHLHQALEEYRQRKRTKGA